MISNELPGRESFTAVVFRNLSIEKVTEEWSNYLKLYWKKLTPVKVAKKHILTVAVNSNIMCNGIMFSLHKNMKIHRQSLWE